MFNRLAGSGRAIVTDIPGTTRDLVTEVVDVDGMAITIVDTAGAARGSADAVEREGISRARAAEEIADLAVVVLDRSRPLNGDDEMLLARRGSGAAGGGEQVRSAAGVERADDRGSTCARCRRRQERASMSCARAIATALSATERLHDTPAVTNARHVDLLHERPRGAAARARRRPRSDTAEEFVAGRSCRGTSLLEEVTGRAHRRRRAAGNLRQVLHRKVIGIAK